MIETFGDDPVQLTDLFQIPYARSQEHLMHVVETVCKGFEDYAQAKYKSSGEPTIIRIMTHEGNMNPLMSQVDMVPDEDLNTRLKFYVSTFNISM